MSLHRILVCGIVLIVVTRISCNLNGLKQEFEFKVLDYEYDDEIERDKDVKSGDFSAYMCPLDVDVDYIRAERRVFITIPRTKKPNPASLGTISSKNSSVIVPYPSWSWHRDLSCKTEHITSVHRIKIDKCGRLWVLDTGQHLGIQICSPQLLAFDLKTDIPIHIIPISKEMHRDATMFASLIIDIRETCEDTFIYMCDAESFALVVCDLKEQNMWKITHRSFYPDPLFGELHVAGSTVNIMEGIMGMDISPNKPKEERKLFYSSMSGGTAYWVYLDQIRNQTKFSSPSNLPEAFHRLESNRRTDSAAMVIDKNGVAFFGLMSTLSLNCWNTGNSDYGKNIDTIAQDSEKLQFGGGIKMVIKRDNEEELWFVTTRRQKVITETLNISDTNFRIFSGNPNELVKGKRCEKVVSPIQDPQI